MQRQCLARWRNHPPVPGKLPRVPGAHRILVADHVPPVLDQFPHQRITGEQFRPCAGVVRIPVAARPHPVLEIHRGRIAVVPNVISPQQMHGPGHGTGPGERSPGQLTSRETDRLRPLDHRARRRHRVNRRPVVVDP